MLNLSGQKFGRLTVTSYSHSNKNGKSCWNCLCECGNNVVALGNSLKSGNTKSCGCLHIEKSSINGKNNALKNIKDLSGIKFGKILVKSFSHTEKGKTYWNCQCDCGEEFLGRADAIESGHTKSCGCLLKNPKAGGWNKLEISGMVFGNLTVIELDSIIREKTYWKCLCKCGQLSIVSGGNLMSGGVASCGCLSESAIATALKAYFKLNYNSSSEYKLFKNPKTNQWLKCDIYIPYGNNPELNGFYIEVHWEQHYKLSYFHKLSAKRNGTTPEQEFEYQKHKDKMKKKYCRKNGYYIEVNLLKIKTVEAAIEYVEEKIKKIIGE